MRRRNPLPPPGTGPAGMVFQAVQATAQQMVAGIIVVSYALGATKSLVAHATGHPGLPWATELPGVLAAALGTAACLLLARRATAGRRAFAVCLALAFGPASWLPLVVPHAHEAAPLYWLHTVSGLPGFTLVVARMPVAGMVAVGANSVLAELARATVAGEADHRLVAGRVALSLFIHLAYGLLGLAAYDLASHVTGQLAASRSRQQGFLTREASLREEERAARFLHDEVLSVLHLVTLEVPAADIAPLARRALDELRAPRPVDPAPVSASQLAAALPPTPAAGAAPHVVTRLAADPLLPGDVAHELVAAADEAIRNAHLHSHGTCTVQVEATAEVVRITVSDDGIGFRPESVAPTSTGIARSILHRVNVLAGCRAAVTSTPGSGTRVMLEWRPGEATPEAPTPDATPLEAVRLAGAWPWVLLAALLASQVLVDLPTLGSAAAVAGVVAMAGMVWAAARDAAQGRPPSALAFLAGLAGMALLASRQVPSADPSALWPFALYSFCCGLLATGGRVGMTWVLFAAGLAVTVFGSAGAGRPVVLLEALRYAIQPLAGSLCALLVRRAMDGVRLARHAEDLAFRASIAAEARRTERAAVHAQVQQAAGDVLARLQEGRPLDEAERRRARQAELILRDWMRGRRLLDAGGRVAALVASARDAGAQVQLLDDAGPHLAVDPARVHAALAHELAAVGPGSRLTARLCPAGRDAVLTIHHHCPAGGRSMAFSRDDLGGGRAPTTHPEGTDGHP